MPSKRAGSATANAACGKWKKAKKAARDAVSSAPDHPLSAWLPARLDNGWLYLTNVLIRSSAFIILAMIAPDCQCVRFIWYTCPFFTAGTDCQSGSWRIFSASLFSGESFFRDAQQVGDLFQAANRVVAQLVRQFIVGATLLYCSYFSLSAPPSTIIRSGLAAISASMLPVMSNGGTSRPR